MKFLVLFLLLTLVGHARAQFETWTNANGRQATMQPINVIERDGEPTARFRLQNGQIVEIKISDLSDEIVVRIEAFSNHNWRVGQGWHEWSGTYTIIKPHPISIFQVMNSDNEWAVHLGMDSNGNVSVSHRRGAREVIARNMTGKPFDITVRDNGHDFEVYLNGEKVSEGSYDRPSGQTNFRWGLYRGERPMNHDTMILVSGATVRAGER